MNSKWIGLFLWVMVMATTGYGQQKESRVKDWGIPQAGAPLNVTYTPDGGPLQGRKVIKGIIYLYNNYKWAVDDLDLIYQNKSWVGKYPLPANCAFFAIKFVAEEDHKIVASDNNGDFGFLATTIGKNNGKLPGGSLAWGIFRKPEFNKAPQGYFDKANISDEAIEMWVRKEMKDYPRNVPVFFDVYLAMLKLSKPEEFPVLARRNLQKLAALPDLTEQTYQIIYDSYNFLLKDKAAADSVKAVILQKFPNGKMQRMAGMVQTNSALTASSGVEPVAAFLKRFPVREYRKDSVLTQNYIYYNFYRQLGTYFFDSARFDELRVFIPEMDFQSLNEVYRFNVTRAFLSKRVPLEKIYPIAKILIDSAISKKSDGSFMQETTYTPKQANYLASVQLDQRLYLHIRILHQMQRDKEALAYMNEISLEGKFADADVNEVRISVYRNTGNANLVKPALEAGLRVNKATPVMLQELKAMYLKDKGDTLGYESYLSKLKEKSLVDQDKQHVISNMIKQPVKSFMLKDLSGKNVNTALLKDQIIVLDFWATWCYPCKMAFPGMQMLVDHYENDQKVAFYFISTMERKASYKEDIAKYLKTSGFRFNVLFDDKNPATGRNDRVFKTMTPFFNSSAIPRKVVIKNGLIRYTSEGYNGSPSGLFDELSYVIEILKSEK
jgi:thiol-disulfide isomerase/thioredoxin